jgi:hypothetical protein
LFASTVLGRSEDNVYLFGGLDQQGQPVPKMRQLDLTTLDWSLSPEAVPGGPRARQSFVMWKGTKKDEIYVFGGKTGSELLQDTWSYSVQDETWKKEKDNGPSARWGSSYCTRVQDGHLQLFGGTFQDPTHMHNDVWKFGPLTVKNLFQFIEFKLDSATLAALLAACMSTITVTFLVVVSVAICVHKCRKRRESRIQSPIIPIPDNRNDFM